MPKLKNYMTVEKLIGYLSKFDPGLKVAIAQPTHDYVGTVLAVPVYDVDIEQAVFSDQHGIFKLPMDSDGYRRDVRSDEEMDIMVVVS